MKIVDTGIIYRNPIPHIWSRHGYFPSVVRLGNGSLVAAFSIGEAFESADLHSYTAVSKDNGATWSKPGELCERVPGFSDFCRISLLQNGEIIAIIQRHDRSRPDTGLGNPENQGFTETEFYTQRSADGISWSAPQKITPPLVGPSFELCCPIIPCSDGKLIFPTSTWKGWDGYCPNGTKAVAFVSEDGGETWNSYIDVMCDPKDEIIYWESRVKELQDGRLLATAWAYDSAGNVDLPDQYAICRREGGADEVFTAPASTGLSGQTMEPVVLSDGRIFSVYRRTDKPGLWGNLSRIEGSEWVNEEEMLLWNNAGGKLFETGENMIENFNVLRFGAPNGFEMEDGTCFICFWCVEDNVSNIRWIRIRI